MKGQLERVVVAAAAFAIGILAMTITAGAQIPGPNVNMVSGTSLPDGDPYLVMEWIDGLGLNYLIETRAPQLKGNRINYLRQLCDAVQYMHDNKWLHRDLCPRNVLIDREGQVKLIDFGLTVPYTPPFCVAGNRTGTVDILAPEIIRRKTTDHRVDLFALGVTAYEMFTGELPWDKTASLQTLLSHMNSTGKDPAELRPDLDKATLNFLRKVIERDPRARFQTAADFREALQNLPPDRTKAAAE